MSKQRRPVVSRHRVAEAPTHTQPTQHTPPTHTPPTLTQGLQADLSVGLTHTLSSNSPSSSNLRSHSSLVSLAGGPATRFVGFAGGPANANGVKVVPSQAHTLSSNSPSSSASSTSSTPTSSTSPLQLKTKRASKSSDGLQMPALPALPIGAGATPPKRPPE
jgi:hypothetical protein